jgi:pimeloyl-ACP methyl ester carboxylesterase
VATFVLIHGAGDVGWYWHLVEAELRARGRDTVALFYQDVPPELAAEALKHSRTQSEARMGEASPLRAWPDVPTRVLICRDDRLFPPAYLRRVARERLGVTPDELDGGHTPALSRPRELADRLHAYATAG